MSVTLFEKEELLGGQVNTASECNLKAKLRWCIEDLTVSCRELGVTIESGRELSTDDVEGLSPYAVIVATGGEPLRPRSIRGSDGKNVFTPPEIISRGVVLEGQNVVVVGSGMTGLETTEILNETGNRVTVIEMAPEIAPGTWFQLTDDELERIRPYNTRFLTKRQLARICDGEVIVINLGEGRMEHIPADSVVLSMGVRPVSALYEQLRDRLPRVVRVGDARASGTIADAVKSAFDACAEIV